MKNSLFDLDVGNLKISDEQKKIYTYVLTPDDFYFDENKFRAWYERRNWKKLGFACPPLYAMYGKMDNGLRPPKVPNYSISETNEQIAARIILW